jgi:hypothetical protein
MAMFKGKLTSIAAVLDLYLTTLNIFTHLISSYQKPLRDTNMGHIFDVALATKNSELNQAKSIQISIPKRFQPIKKYFCYLFRNPDLLSQLEV